MMKERATAGAFTSSAVRARQPTTPVRPRGVTAAPAFPLSRDTGASDALNRDFGTKAACTLRSRRRTGVRQANPRPARAWKSPQRESARALYLALSLPVLED